MSPPESLFMLPLVLHCPTPGLKWGSDKGKQEERGVQKGYWGECWREGLKMVNLC